MGPRLSPGVGPLRWIAIAGTGIVLLWQATSLPQMQPRQEWGIVVVVLAAIAVGLACQLLLPDATRTLGRHGDLLLPLGLLIPTAALLNALAAVPVLAAVLARSWTLTVLSLSFSLSLLFLLQIVLAVVYAGWTTTLILQAVRQDRVEPLQGLAEIGRWFWRVLGAEALGWLVLFAALIVDIAIGAAVGVAAGPAALPLALIAIGVFSLIWNLMTAALLPVVVAQRRPFGQTVREGIRVSWQEKGRWWLAVVAQMVLLGWVTLIVVSFNSNTPPGSFNMKSSTEFSVNAFWTGGYQDECHWYTELMKAAETPPLPLFESLLGILFAVLAIVVKLEITSEVDSPEAIPDEAPSLYWVPPNLNRNE
jgi:hypothetical protein